MNSNTSLSLSVVALAVVIVHGHYGGTSHITIMDIMVTTDTTTTMDTDIFMLARL
jgi:hypothetical protein